MNNEPFDIPDILFDTIIPRDLTLDQKKEIFWATGHPPIWMSINDYIFVLFTTQTIKKLKNNWDVSMTEENKGIIMLACIYVNKIKEKYFSSFYPNFLNLEFSHYAAHIIDVGKIKIFPNNPEILLLNSQNCFKNKVLIFDPIELEKFFMNLIVTLDYKITICEYGTLCRTSCNKLIITHSYPEISDIIIEFPKWH